MGELYIILAISAFGSVRHGGLTATPSVPEDFVQPGETGIVVPVVSVWAYLPTKPQ